MIKVIEISPMAKISKKRHEEFVKARDEFLAKFKDVSFVLSQRMEYRFHPELLKKPLTNKDVWIDFSGQVRKKMDEINKTHNQFLNSSIKI